MACKWTVLLLIGFMIVACSSVKKFTRPQAGDPAIHQINAELQTAYANNKNISSRHTMNVPTAVSNELMPALTVEKPSKKEVQPDRFNVSVNNVPAQAFFMGLVKGTKYNMVVNPKITGTITLHLKNVTIQDALDAVHDNYGYEYRRTRYGFQVFPPGLETRIFTVNYLNVDRTGKSNTLVSSGQISQKVNNNQAGTQRSTLSGVIQRNSNSANSNLSPTSSVETSSKADFWKQLTASLKLIIGDKDGREVIVNPAAGLIIVKAFPGELQEVAQYLDEVQSTMTRQVILDAKIVEVELSAGFQAGIDWTLLGLSETGNADLTDNLKTFNKIFTLNASFRGGFSTIVNLLSTQGNVQILSSPRIATLNNQKAIIKVGQDEFFITNVSNTTLAGSSTENTQDVELTPFFSGVALDVTPEIDSKGGIILHIHPLVSRVTQKDLDYTLNGTSQSLPLALSQIRESDNIVYAKNGQIVVIGGLMENDTKEYIGSVPGLGKAPLIGPLFRRTNQEATKSELVILLRPVIVGDNVWTKRLREEAQRIKHLNRGYHIGSHPKVFGNLAEPSFK